MTGRPRLLAVALLAVVAPVACGSTVLPADEVAAGAEDALEEEAGSRPEVSCPEDLEAEVGAETRCLLTGEGLEGEDGVTVTVTAVEGDRAEFGVTVDEERTGGGR